MIVSDVPDRAADLAFGMLLAGTGTAWVDDFALTEVSPSEPTTTPFDEAALKEDGRPFRAASGVAEAAMNMHFED